MSILDRLRSFGRAKPKASKQEYFLNDPGLIPYLVGKDEISEGIFSVISRVSNVFASLPLKMIDVEFGQPDDCPAYNLLSEGPRYFTKFDFFRDVEVLRNYQGNAYFRSFAFFWPSEAESEQTRVFFE
ncbi:hypothetical protein [Enterococcus faecium]|uniref:hypothetical protein n=1 Tax=Enterococcus faecium TaxID=1352 RepID=UPI00164FB874|nr:hypothetical protein [Enterococcus faecium]